ncbi:MAG: PAS domain S-box protein, partial [Spirochaetaceae bacterium]
ALRLRSIAIASSVEGIAFADFDSKLTYVNSSFLKMWGYEEEDQVVGRYVLEFWISRDAASKVVDALDRDGFWKGELVAVRKDGSSFEVGVKASIARNARGDPLCMMASFEDITEQKKATEEQRQLEAQLHQSQKMETIGQLAGGIAHDFNNLLTVITGTSEMALMNISPGDRFYDEFIEVRKTAERATDLSNQLLAFSRRQIVKPRIININRVLMDLERLFRRLIGEDIELVFSPFDDLWLVKTDPGQFE